MASNHFICTGSARPSLAESANQSWADDRLEPILLGESAAVRQLRSQIQRIAPHFRTALIRGEAGSGKQAVARAIHALSPGADGPFVVADACALADVGNASGFSPQFELAEGGTLYLARACELSLRQQDSLMRLLRTCEERRATSQITGRRVATRIIAASDRDLRTLAAVGQFRQDLYASLSAVEIVVPPVRTRAEDIPALAERLLQRLGEASGMVAKAFAQATLVQLQARSWPNNFAELERVVGQAAALAEGSLIEPRHLLTLGEAELPSPAPSAPVKIERLDDVIERYVLEVLTRCGGNKLRTAELLGISRSTLYRMLGTRPATMGAQAE